MHKNYNQQSSKGNTSMPSVVGASGQLDSDQGGAAASEFDSGVKLDSSV